MGRPQGSHGDDMLVRHGAVELVSEHSGDAAALLADDPQLDRPAVRIMHVERRAFVLGSTTSTDLVSGAAAAEGIDVVRRRSGGGVVWVAPGEQIWIDVVIPATHPLWCADVTRSMRWVGRVVAGALATMWAPDRAQPVLSVAMSPVGSRRWGIACFAAIGHGEVVATPPEDPRGRPDPHHIVKVAGLSQRRNRFGSVLQLSIPLRWEPSEWRRFLDLGDEGAQIDWRLRHAVAAPLFASGVDPVAAVAIALADHIALAERR